MSSRGPNAANTSCRWSAVSRDRSTSSWLRRNVAHWAQSGSAGVSRSDQRRYLVEPARFTTLKRGGPAYGYQVEAIVYKGGHIFGDGLPYTLLTFNQR